MPPRPAQPDSDPAAPEQPAEASGRQVPSATPFEGATRIVAALNRAYEDERRPRERVEVLLDDLRAMVGYDADAEVLLYTDPQRRPAPRLVDRVWRGPTFARIEPRSHAAMQAMIDRMTPAVWEAHLGRALAERPVPVVEAVSTGVPGDWFRDEFLPKHLAPIGWADVLSSCWAADGNRIVSLNVMRRREHRPFDDRDRALMRMMVLAAGPLVDRELLRPVVDGRSPDVVRCVERLTPRQKEVLAKLLEGLSEKEVGRALHRSTETVHSHVKQIYRTFDVASRGELMAKFVDERLRHRVEGEGG